MNIEPLNNYLIVEVIKNEKEGGEVLLPDAHKKEEFGMGLVLAVEADNLNISKGDKVLFDKYLLINVKIEKDTEVKFIKFDDILGVIKPEELVVTD